MLYLILSLCVVVTTQALSTIDSLVVVKETPDSIEYVAYVSFEQNIGLTLDSTTYTYGEKVYVNSYYHNDEGNIIDTLPISFKIKKTGNPLLLDLNISSFVGEGEVLTQLYGEYVIQWNNALLLNGECINENSSYDFIDNLQYQLHNDTLYISGEMLLPCSSAGELLVYLVSNDDDIVLQRAFLHGLVVPCNCIFALQLMKIGDCTLEKYDVTYKGETTTVYKSKTSISTIEQQSSISPNPVRNTLYISLPQGEHSITIYNATGSPVLKQQVAEPRAQIGVNGLPAGVYFVQVDGGEMLKFVKE